MTGGNPRNSRVAARSNKSLMRLCPLMSARRDGRYFSVQTGGAVVTVAAALMLGILRRVYLRPFAEFRLTVGHLPFHLQGGELPHFKRGASKRKWLWGCGKPNR